MRINPKSKGGDGEREFAKLLTRHLGIVVKRNLEQSRESGADLLLPGWDIEVKRRAHYLQEDEWWQECVKRTRNSNRPVLAYRADYQPWRVRVRMGDIAGHTDNFPGLTADLNIEAFCALVRSTSS